MAQGTASLIGLMSVAFIAFSGGAGAAETIPPTSEKNAPPATYASIRTEVTVQAGDPELDEPRPRNYFQLAGAAQSQLCSEVLEAFNEPGRHSDGSSDRWLLDNSHHIDFASLDPRRAPGTQYVFPDLEYVRVDIDADGQDEHVYRLNSVRHSYHIQRLMIVPDELQRQPQLLITSYGEACKRIDPRADCTSVPELIGLAVRAGVPNRLKNEWLFTQQGAAFWATADEASEKLIDGSRNRRRRNVADERNSLWSLYRVASGVVAVGLPLPFEFAPPELLVYVPSKHRPGDLQCVLMPRVWYKPELDG